MNAHRTLILALAFSKCLDSDAQVQCVLCYDRNERVQQGPVIDLIQNGSFEIGTCTPSQVFCPNSNIHSCDIPSWTCTGGGTLTYAAVYATFETIVPDGTRAVYFGNEICEACPIPNLSCVVQNGCTYDALPFGYPVNEAEYGGTLGVSLGQEVNGLTVGATYMLEFWAGGESYVQDMFTDPGLFAVDVGFGRVLLKCEPTMPGSADVGTRYQIVFTATAASHLIQFTNWGHIATTATELVLDDVRLFAAGEGPPCAQGIEGSAGPAIEIQVMGTMLAVQGLEGRTGSLVLIDPQGRTVMRQAVRGAASVPLDGIAAGPYLCKLVLADGTVRSRRFVKQ